MSVSWDTPNPEADAVIRDHHLAVGAIAVKTLSKCPDCKSLLTEAVTHTGAKIKTDCAGYDRFIVFAGCLHVASGRVVRSHRCSPGLNRMNTAKADFESTKNFSPEDFERAERHRIVERRNDRIDFVDVPDPVSGARSEGE